MIGGVARPLGKENFVFGELKGLISGPFSSKFINIYELWRLHASLPKIILYFATSKWLISGSILV